MFTCAGLNRPMLKVGSREFAHLSGNWVVELIRQRLQHEAPGFRDWSDDACPDPTWPSMARLVGRCSQFESSNFFVSVDV